MQYRKFGKLDWKASALGFGCMRLPIVGGDHNQIDEAEAVRMIRYAIDQGVNYFDSAYPYHGGNSERVLGKALKDGYRAKVRIATKMPSWMVETAQDFDRFLGQQLERLDVDHIDLYLLHGLRESRWSPLRDLGVLPWAEKAMADGRIGHLGFSFHDTFKVFQEIVDAYDNWTMCQIQYNYMNEEVQAGTQGLEYAASRGLAVVVMEPLLGGKLASPPPVVQALWDTAPRPWTAADWALHWLWNKPQVTVVLSGMSAMEQVRQNVASAGSAAVGSLGADDLALVARVRDKYNELCPIPCTQCRYCMPCPNGVDIPHNFAVFNEGAMYTVFAQSRQAYTRWIDESARASACIQCRECEPKCPQKILISEWMPVVDEVLGQGRPYEACVLPG